MSQVTNPFDSESSAQRYQAGRFAFHPVVLSPLRPFLKGHERAADVACGTGLSSVALAELVREVLAFDSSASMLAHAAPHSRVSYAQASAESLPLPDHTLDALTVSQAFHWFDRAAFLHEARRTLKADGVLFLYDFFFLGRMTGQADFAHFMGQYGKRYPTPPRHRDPFGPDEAAAAGFSFQEQRFEVTWKMFQAELLGYLLTHSNTLAAAQRGELREETTHWLDERLRPFFAEPTQELHFLGWYAALTPLPADG